MKKFTITNSDHVREVANLRGVSFHFEFEGGDDMQVSDGYHTMDEVYEHRITLFIALCRIVGKAKLFVPYMLGGGPDQTMPVRAWRSKQHADGSSFDGWFVMGIGKNKKQQITYHLPLSKWEETEFAETLDKAPEWDGHTSDDVLDRLKSL